MNYKWKLEPPTPEKQEAAERLAKELNISPILGRLLIERNITTVADAKKFFRPSLTGLYDPFMFTDMDRAVERLNKALGRKERIMVYGDYDVDGCTAVALVYKFRNNIIPISTIISPTVTKKGMACRSKESTMHTKARSN